MQNIDRYCFSYKKFFKDELINGCFGKLLKIPNKIPVMESFKAKPLTRYGKKALSHRNCGFVLFTEKNFNPFVTEAVLYDNVLRHERVNRNLHFCTEILLFSMQQRNLTLLYIILKNIIKAPQDTCPVIFFTCEFIKKGIPKCFIPISECLHNISWGIAKWCEKGFGKVLFVRDHSFTTYASFPKD